MQATMTNSGINKPDHSPPSPHNKPELKMAEMDKVVLSIDHSKDSSWNTKHIGLRMGADAVSAASAAVLVAPFITMIDKCLTSSNLLLLSLLSSLKQLALQPHRFLLSKPFGLIFVSETPTLNSEKFH